MNNAIISPNTMTSLQIAEVTGKPHNDVLKAIRKMEPAWVKVGQGNFSQSSYINRQGKQQPMYELTKTESLYIASKFNDEARAKLVIRWEELEKERRQRNEREQLPKAVDGVLGDVSPRTVLKAMELCVQTQSELSDMRKRLIALEQASATPTTKAVARIAGVRHKPTDSVTAGTALSNIEAAHLYGMTASQLRWVLCRHGSVRGDGRRYYLKANFAKRGYIIRNGQAVPYMRPRDVPLINFKWTPEGLQWLDRVFNRYGIQTTISPNTTNHL